MASVDLVNEGVSAAYPFPARFAFVQIGVAVDNEVVFDAQETLAIFDVPAGTLVLDVLAYTPTAWTTSVTLNVGDGDDTDGWLATAKVAPTTAQTDGLAKRSTKATAEAYAGGKLYGTADTIDVVIGGATPAVGRTQLWVVFIPNATARYTIS